MQLSITRRTDLATRALLALDRSGQKRKASDLAAELDASAGFLTQALTPLVNYTPRSSIQPKREARDRER